MKWFVLLLVAGLGQALMLQWLNQYENNDTQVLARHRWRCRLARLVKSLPEVMQVHLDRRFYGTGQAMIGARNKRSTARAWQARPERADSDRYSRGRARCRMPHSLPALKVEQALALSVVPCQNLAKKRAHPKSETRFPRTLCRPRLRRRTPHQRQYEEEDRRIAQRRIDRQGRVLMQHAVPA